MFVMYYFQAYFDNSETKRDQITFLGNRMNLQDIELNALSNLCVFLIAQTYAMIKYPQKATAITKRPYVVWLQAQKQ